MKQRIRKFFITRALRVFLKRKYFQGDYAQNQMDMKKWFNDTEQCRVIVMRIENSRFHFSPQIPKSEDVDLVRALVKEQARIYSRTLRKKHEMVIYYVEDHFFTRLFGCKPGTENRMLKA
jgi:hypothetical protein